MDNVLIDDRRIHVDFSQSVSRLKPEPGECSAFSCISVKWYLRVFPVEWVLLVIVHSSNGSCNVLFAAGQQDGQKYVIKDRSKKEYPSSLLIMCQSYT